MKIPRREFNVLLPSSVLVAMASTSGRITKALSDLLSLQQQVRLIIGDENLVSGRPNAEEYLLDSLRHVTTDSEGNVFLSEVGGTFVKKFSPEGEFLLKFGGEGGAPYEFAIVGDFKVLGNSIYVNDGRKRSLAKFNLEGVYSDKFIRTGDIVPVVTDIQVVEEDLVMMHGFPANYSGLDEMPQFHLVDMDDGLVQSFGKPSMYKDAERFVRGSNTSNLHTFFYGSMAVDRDSKTVYFVRRNYPKEILAYEIGADEPRVVSVDNDLSGDMRVTDYVRGETWGTRFMSESGERRLLIVGQRAREGIFLVDGVLYMSVQDRGDRDFPFSEGETSIRGYSVNDGSLVFRKILDPESYGNLQLKSISSDLKAYFTMSNPYSAVVVEEFNGSA